MYHDFYFGGDNFLTGLPTTALWTKWPILRGWMCEFQTLEVWHQSLIWTQVSLILESTLLTWSRLLWRKAMKLEYHSGQLHMISDMLQVSQFSRSSSLSCSRFFVYWLILLYGYIYNIYFVFLGGGGSGGEWKGQECPCTCWVATLQG